MIIKDHKGVLARFGPNVKSGLQIALGSLPGKCWLHRVSNKQIKRVTLWTASRSMFHGLTGQMGFCEIIILWQPYSVCHSFFYGVFKSNYHLEWNYSILCMLTLQSQAEGVSASCRKHMIQMGGPLRSFEVLCSNGRSFWKAFISRSFED